MTQRPQPEEMFAADVLRLKLPSKQEVLEAKAAIQQRSGADKYVGAVAEGYDAKRETTEKWQKEQVVVEEWLSAFPAGTHVLDVPVGSGRFLPAYRKLGFEVTGLDVSDDMLRQARTKDAEAFLRIGDARELNALPRSFDLVVCTRLFRWLSPEDCTKVVDELERVARQAIIFTARVENHPHARSRELLLAPFSGWQIEEIEIEPGYVAFKLERTDA